MEQDHLPIAFGDGFHDEEWEERQPFRWLSRRGVVHLSPSPALRYLDLSVHSHFQDLSQQLTVSSSDGATAYDLSGDWSRLSLAVPAGSDCLTLEVNKLYPPRFYPTDRRELAVKVRRPELHQDHVQHASIHGQTANRAQNLREMLTGKAVLESTPPNLGIDLCGVCNVKPPCVFCGWEWSKSLEGANAEVPFTRQTFIDYGDFFDHAQSLINCSIGEPFLMRNLDELLEMMSERGQHLEISTNGQILTERQIQSLLGRDIHLYISLDAATPETYAKLRNNTFPRIMENIRRLVAAKGGRGKLPLIFFVFIPMRVNVDEVEEFVRLCADLEVDRLILRPLNDSPGERLTWDRGGHHFVYRDQQLPFRELLQLSGRVDELCRQAGVELANQLDFGSATAEMFAREFAAGRRQILKETQADPAPVPAAKATLPEPEPASDEPNMLGRERWPVCIEPWQNLYILRRGVLPCCYGAAPLGPMDSYRQVWNGPLLQGIRRELAAGRFHRYCLHSFACPLVNKSDHAARLPYRQRALRHLRRRARALAGGPARASILARGEWAWIRISRLASEPAYFSHHVRRVLGLRRGPYPPQRKQ
jgi:MoaA/NifB/PqqE/SkfB family radical SAM enzyme